MILRIVETFDHKQLDDKRSILIRVRKNDSDYETAIQDPDCPKELLESCVISNNGVNYRDLEKKIVSWMDENWVVTDVVPIENEATCLLLMTPESEYDEYEHENP